MIPWWWLIVAWVVSQATVVVWLWFFRKPEGEARGGTGEDDCDPV